MKKMLPIMFDDLDSEAQASVLDFYHIAAPVEMNFDTVPLFILEGECTIEEVAEDIKGIVETLEADVQQGFINSPEEFRKRFLAMYNNVFEEASQKGSEES